MRRNQVSTDTQPQYPQSFLEIVLPERRVPFRGAALEHFGAPDVVHQNVDMAVRAPNPIREVLHFGGAQMIDSHGDARSTKACHELSRFFDGFGTFVVGARRAIRSRAPPGANDRRTRLREGTGNAASRPARRAGHDCDTVSECVRSAMRRLHTGEL
jgi:hypothetical protein